MSHEVSDQWYVRSRGKILGPFTFRNLEVLRSQNRLAKFDEVSRGDRRSWVLASSLPELFPAEAPSHGAAPGSQEPEITDAVYSIDPATAPEAAEWHYLGSEGVSSPRRLSEMIQLARSGVILPETMVWTSSLTQWTPAKNVPALGHAQPAAFAPAPAPGANGISTEATSGKQVETKVQGGSGFSVAGFILGLLALLAGVLTFLTLALTSVAMRNKEVVGLIFIALVVFWASSGLLSVTFGAVGVYKCTRAGASRRGFGLGLSGIILGLLALTGLLVLVFIIALGLISFSGNAA
jgi:hypothetical protein